MELEEHARRPVAVLGVGSVQGGTGSVRKGLTHGGTEGRGGTARQKTGYRKHAMGCNGGFRGVSGLEWRWAQTEARAWDEPGAWYSAGVRLARRSTNTVQQGSHKLLIILLWQDSPGPLTLPRLARTEGRIRSDISNARGYPKHRHAIPEVGSNGWKIQGRVPYTDRDGLGRDPVPHYPPCLEVDTGETGRGGGDASQYSQRSQMNESEQGQNSKHE